MEKYTKENNKNIDKSGIEHVRKDNSAPEEKEITVADVLNAALKKKDETIEYIYLEFQKDKKKSLRKTTREEIKNWFKGKAYPDLDQTYKLAYIIPIDPSYVWKLKLRNEKKLHKQRIDILSHVADREMSVKTELLTYTIVYGFIFSAVLIFCLAARTAINAYNYHGDKEAEYVEGAIDAGANYASNVTGNGELLESYTNTVQKYNVKEQKTRKEHN